MSLNDSHVKERASIKGSASTWCALSFADRLKVPNQERSSAWTSVALSSPGENEAAFEVAVLSAFAVVLARYCGEPSYRLGVVTPDDEQGWSNCELTIQSESEVSISYFLSQVQAAYRKIEAGALHEQANAPTYDAEPPRMSAAFVGIAASQLQGLPLAAQGDLVLSLGGGGAALLHYDALLFDAETVARFACSLQRAVSTFWQHGELPLGQLGLLSEAEELRQLAVWSGPQVVESARPLHQIVVEQARRTPAAVAVSFRKQHLTYGELERRSRALALRLRQSGVGRHARVAVCLEPSFDTVICLLGVLRAGATYVPLDPGYPLERLALMLADTAAEVLLTQRALLGSLPNVSRCWCVDDLPHAPVNESASEALDERVAMAEVAYVIYTSGTTGTPKGVMISHQNLAHYVLSAQRKYGFRASDVQPAMARSTFSITMFEMFSMLAVGGRLIVLERDHVLDFRRLIATLREATVLHASPSLLRRLLSFARDHDIAVADFDGLRHVSSGGDMVSGDLLESLKCVFRAAELFVIYGCSEISCMGCTFEVPRDRTITRSMVGSAFENMAVRLYDAQRALVPFGVVGEIYLGGAGVALGYLGREELTRERFVEIDGQRFYRTGDLGRSDESGQIEILGRADFQLKLRGMRIEPGEVESTLRAVAGVKEAVVATRDLGSGEPSLVAYAVLDEEQTPHVRALRDACRAKLPDYMVPLVYVVLAKMPVNLNQKIDRKALPMPSMDDLEALRDFVPPQTPEQRRIAQIWERLLGSVRPVGIRDNFFEVGGNSLMSVTLMMEIEQAFGRALPLSTLLTDPSVEKLALALERPPHALRDSLVLMRDGGDEPPLFFVHDGEGETLPYLNLAKCLKGDRKVYGIQPHATNDHPMLHSRLDEVVEHYVSVVRAAQPAGPYYLGGLCIGGFIALEVARSLQKQGEAVGLVILLDAAHVHAVPKSRSAARLESFRSAVHREASKTSLSLVERSTQLVKTAYRKTSNTLAYEVKSRSSYAQNAARMRMFRFYLEQGIPMPDFLKGIPVQVVLRFAEREFQTPEPYRGEVILLRATSKSPAFDGTLIDDTPYVENFVSPLLGWEGNIESLKVCDVAGGHSSMLQSPNVEDLASLLQMLLEQGAGEHTACGARAPESRDSMLL